METVYEDNFEKLSHELQKKIGRDQGKMLSV